MQSTKKVLISEDDPTTRKIIKSCVEKLNLVAIESSNGRRAWDLLCDNSDISLLITDMAMPGMGGQELIAATRNSGNYKDLPIIVVSGIVGVDDISALLESGASRFLPKPVQVNHLVDYIVALLQQKRG